jgi:hypothetical protein
MNIPSKNILGSAEAREVGKELYLVIQSTVSSFENISTEAREVGIRAEPGNTENGLQLRKTS